MSSAEAWLADAFFEDPSDESLDGGGTNHGALWHAVSPRWGHSMHTMCSYQGMFPPKLAHYFIQRFSSPGDVVLDPFSGRGTTALQARVEGRRTIGNDLNPLAYVLTRAKATPPSWAGIMTAVDELEKGWRRTRSRSFEAPADIAMLFHPMTLAQLNFVRSYLFRRPMSAWCREEFMIAGAVAGILHGNHRRDGTSQYLSISMPNTFSMAPAYVRNYIATHGLEQIEQDLFERLRDKLARLYLDSLPGTTGKVTNQDAVKLLSGKSVEPASVDLLLTSPPYLNVVNYGTSNWIRLWWLGLDGVATDGGTGRRRLDAKLDHQHNYESYRAFMKRTFKATSRVLKRKGVAVFVIGDVATPGRESLPLAQEVWEDVGEQTGLRLVDVVEDELPSHNNKVSRIWGDTKGNATDRDRVLIVARSDGAPARDERDVSWEEPYKDAGPDEAHDRVRSVRGA